MKESKNSTILLKAQKSRVVGYAKSFHVVIIMVDISSI